MSVTQVLLHADPFPPQSLSDVFVHSGQWPCSWIKYAALPAPPFVVAYRKKFVLDMPTMFRAHVAADERYQLFLDGERVGRGSERGDAAHWFFDSYDFDLPAGEHVIVARVWSLGDLAPYAQMSARHGFLFAPEDEVIISLLGTGVADWDAKALGGYEFIRPQSVGATGVNLRVNGAGFDWNFERGEGDGWESAVISHPAISDAARIEAMPVQRLTPATLPPQLDIPRQVGKVRHVADFELSADGAIQTFPIPVRAADHLENEQAAWQQLIEGASTLTVPAHTRRRVIVDLENYYCAYPEITTSGGRGSTLRVHWQEALYDRLQRDVAGEGGKQGKGNRDEIEGKYFVCVWNDADGVGDTFLPGTPSGSCSAACDWSTLWWQCGRYVEIVVSTQEEPLTLEYFGIRETRYPLEMESVFETNDERLNGTIPLMVRVMQMCAHETYMDCPFYEQLQYIGDTRLEVLTTYVMTRDDRLPRKALQLFGWSRLSEGLTYSRYPSRQLQVIPPFSLFWIAMVHDFALWRDDMAFVRSLMPGVRAVLDAFRTYLNEDGLAEAPHGWNFVDWVPGWTHGIPPEGDRGVSGVLNWHLALAANQAAELEELLGETAMAARQRKFAESVAAAVSTHFWDEERGLFADDLQHEYFSEHTQCLALLSGLLSEPQKSRVASGLCEDENLARTTIYFSFYLFEAYQLLGRADKFFERLQLWFGLENHGLKTTFEEADINTTRSDCHAWGAHPLFHYFTTILGVRPTAPGFSKFAVLPEIGGLQRVKGVLPHPRGEIKIDLRHENGVLAASIDLPDCVEGEFDWCDQRLPLRSPCDEISFSRST